MKITKKIAIIFFTILCIVMLMPQKIDAVNINPTSVMNGADKFITNAENRELFDKDSEKDAVDQIYFIMLSIGVVLAVVVGIVLGIQFITTGAAGQAKVKEKLVVYVVGAFVIFGAFGIWRLVYNVLNGLA